LLSIKTASVLLSIKKVRRIKRERSWQFPKDTFHHAMSSQFVDTALLLIHHGRLSPLPAISCNAGRHATKLRPRAARAAVVAAGPHAATSSGTDAPQVPLPPA
jgi:hypothetical protein